MSLWSNTDENISKPKFINPIDLPFTYFVDETEAQQKANKDKGINGAGWWDIREYTDSQGNSRYKTQLLVAMTTPFVVSGDADDDQIVADINPVIIIDSQPTDFLGAGGSITFSVDAYCDPSGNVLYQWQRAAAATPKKFVNLGGQDGFELVLDGFAAPINDGDKYRVVMTSDTGAPKLNSAVATFIYD